MVVCAVTDATIRSSRYYVITTMCNQLYELAGAQSEAAQRKLLVEVDELMTQLWDLHEVEDG